MHVESVAWITEQKNTVSLVFYLAATAVHPQFDETDLGVLHSDGGGDLLDQKQIRL